MLTKSAVKAAKEYERSIPPRDVARARVTGGEIAPGPYLATPLLGWVTRIGGGRFLVLTMTLTRIADTKLAGTLGWAIPFGPRTEEDCAKVLAALGWDGRMWPKDAGWPGDTEHEGPLQKILIEAEIASALVFPPDPVKGAISVRIQVLSRTQPFALDPACVGPSEVPEGWQSRLWAIIDDPLLAHTMVQH